MSALETFRLFNLSIVNATMQAAVEAMLAPGKKRTVAFVNAHCLNVAAKDATHRWALDRADFLLPDGSGLQLAAKLNGGRFVENLNGTDLFVPLCQAAAAKGQSVFLFGSAEGVAARAAEKAREIAPGLTIAGVRNGFFSERAEDALIEEINASGAAIVLVALGVPKQDVWIARNRHRLTAHLVMGVGAQFDFWSGRVARAPTLMRQLGVEWMMRLAIEPRRMARRYLVGNFAFIARALARQDLSHRVQEATVEGRRLLDILISGGALLALAPLFALIAIAIRMESPGPVMFRQTRVGHNGKTFTLFKFRSMYRDAEARRAALLATSDREGICFKAKNDPRVTGVGRLLRRFSLDELPQIFNVLKGEMAIVGPRPALPQEVAAYSPIALVRLGAKPGLTGLWQVGGRAEVGFDRMIEMDSAHVGSRSILLDIAVIALTARAVISGRGAY